ncbi:hypothetical protein ABEB36_003648 [Hypothenemus hampei]|uniref:HTH CENPB-type domain-containing protein n=1 Tax=Hypothenemus hampei TaxID=57062 RepID=A0ABD1FAL0_HYPHA
MENPSCSYDFVTLDLMKSMFEENGMLTPSPPTDISCAARAMAKVFYDAILGAINDNELVSDEDLILPYDSDADEEYEELIYKEDYNEIVKSGDEFDPVEYEKKTSQEYIPLQYKLKAVAFANANPKASLQTIQSRGFAKLKDKKTLLRWKKVVQKGGSRIDKLNMINEQCFERFVENRKNHEQVTTRMIQQWAMATAFPYISEEFSFTAGLTWVQNFKKKYRIRQRKITKFINKSDIATLEETLQAAETFQTQTKLLISSFSPDYVINTDQTGCQYQTGVLNK